MDISYFNPTPNIALKKVNKYSYIYFEVWYKGNRSRFQIGSKVITTQWCKEKQRAYTSPILSTIDNFNNEATNRKIESFIARYSDFINYLCKNPSKINTFHEELKKYMARPRKKTTTQEQEHVDVFKTIENAVSKKIGNKHTCNNNYIGKGLKAFRAFSEHRRIPITNFEMINADLIYEFKEFLENGLYTNEGKPYAMSSLNSIIKYAVAAIKCLLVEHLSIDRAKGIPVPQLSDKTAIDNAIALRDNEVLKLWRYKPETKSDEEIRDMFLLLCLTGQRVSDLPKIDGGVSTTSGIPCLKIVQEKCSHKIDTDIIFPLAIEILKKYEHLPTNGIDKKINENIGRIAKEAGICGKEQVSIHYQGSDKPTVTEHERSSLIASHTGRRTFVSVLSVHGWNYERIKKYTGQSLKMVEHYDKSTPIDARIFKESPQHERLQIYGEETTQQPCGTPPQQHKQDVRYPNSVEDARKVLEFLGIRATTDKLGELLYLIVLREHEILTRCHKQLDITTIKHLFNNESPLEERCLALKLIVDFFSRNPTPSTIE